MLPVLLNTDEHGSMKASNQEPDPNKERKKHDNELIMIGFIFGVFALILGGALVFGLFACEIVCGR